MNDIIGISTIRPFLILTLYVKLMKPLFLSLRTLPKLILKSLIFTIYLSSKKKSYLPPLCMNITKGESWIHRSFSLIKYCDT